MPPMVTPDDYDRIVGQPLAVEGGQQVADELVHETYTGVVPVDQGFFLIGGDRFGSRGHPKVRT